MYYAYILISVVTFGVCFALNDSFRRIRGSGLKISIEATFLGSVSGVVFLLIFSGFTLEFTPFTLIMALIACINGIAFTFFSFKALEQTNLSLYSMFSMLGGMLLPFLQGVIFYGEAITLAKTVCVALIFVALSLTVKRGEKKNGYVYYAGIFILNGMSGVLSKLFNELPFDKTSPASYSLWIAICSLFVSGILWLILNRKRNPDEPKFSIKACVIGCASGGINRIANFLLVLALVHVDASAQYPLVTGGVMIVCTLISLFSNNKPSKKELLAISVAFLGTLAMFVIPI